MQREFHFRNISELNSFDPHDVFANNVDRPNFVLLRVSLSSCLITAPVIFACSLSLRIFCLFLSLDFLVVSSSFFDLCVCVFDIHTVYHQLNVMIVLCGSLTVEIGYCFKQIGFWIYSNFWSEKCVLFFRFIRCLKSRRQRIPQLVLFTYSHTATVTMRVSFTCQSTYNVHCMSDELWLLHTAEPREFQTKLEMSDICGACSKSKLLKRL